MHLQPVEQSESADWQYSIKMIVKINDTIVKGDINAMDKMNHGAVKRQL